LTSIFDALNSLQEGSGISSFDGKLSSHGMMTFSYVKMTCVKQKMTFYQVKMTFYYATLILHVCGMRSATDSDSPVVVLAPRVLSKILSNLDPFFV